MQAGGGPLDGIEDKSGFSYPVNATAQIRIEELIASFASLSLPTSDWSEITLENDAGCEPYTRGQEATGGNPGPYRRHERQCSGEMTPLHFYEYELGTFDPSSLAVGETFQLAYCEDAVAFSLPSGVSSLSSIGVWQGFTFFSGPPIAMSSPEWKRTCTRYPRSARRARNRRRRAKGRSGSSSAGAGRPDVPSPPATDRSTSSTPRTGPRRGVAWGS